MILRLTTRHENGDRSVAPASRPAVVWASSPAFASPVTTCIFEGARGTMSGAKRHTWEAVSTESFRPLGRGTRSDQASAAIHPVA